MNEFEKKLKEVEIKLLTLKKEAASAQEKHEGYQKVLLEKKQLEENLIKNNYLEAEHKKDQSAVAQLKEQLQKAGKEDEARSEQAQRIKEINQLSTKRHALKKEETSLLEQQKPYKGLKDERALIEAKEITLKKECDELIAQKEKLLQEKGRIEADQANLKKLEEHAANFITESKKLSLEIEEYDVISQALGKEGIQALLIEQALPEIENEANALLSQLTDNQSHIIIDSLRDLKKGGSKETLDIKISDASGIRPYELFSGGEAFRIDFALRIAISKLLARRAGTSLQTLIIDEGFGSQDEDGLNNIMEVIHKIQDSFCKVIIVSHLASMKEQFPVHFYVEKLAQGSAVTIIEQG